MKYITDDDSKNPIFSSYNRVDPNFNENIDQYVEKTPYEKYIDSLEKQNKATKKENVNGKAIQNIPVVPDFVEDEYEQLETNQMPKWFQELNVATPEEINEWKSKGKMGIADTWSMIKKNGWYYTPFAGTAADATMAVRNANTLRKLKNGEQVSEVDKELLVDYLRDIKQIEARGGHTFGGKALDIIATSSTYALEFGLGLATLEEGVGFASLGKTLSTIGAKKSARKALTSALKAAAVESTMTGAKKTIPLSAAKKIYKDAAKDTAKALSEVSAKEAIKETTKALPKALLTSAELNMKRMPQHFVRSIADKQLSTGVYVTDAGDATFLESENIGLSIMKALGDTTFETLTETSGWMFSPISKYFAAPIRKLLPEKFYKEFSKLVESRYGKPATEVLKKYGYDGVIEEMGEELLNRFLSQTFGLNGLEDYTLDGFLNNVLYANDPSMWGAEALSFGVSSLGGHAAAGGISKAAETWRKHKDNKATKELYDKSEKLRYSPEQFYLDQGLVRINGSQSLAESSLRNRLAMQGVDDETINEFVTPLSEYEIRDALKDFMNYKTADELKTEANIAAQNAIKEDFANRLKKVGYREDVALASAAMMSAFLGKHAKDKSIMQKWYNKLQLTNKPVNEVQQAILDSIPEEYKVEYTPEEVRARFNKAIADYSAGKISEEEMDEAALEYEEYQQRHPEVVTTTRKIRTPEEIASAKTYAEEINAAISEGNLPTNKEAEKYAEAGHEKLKDIVIRAKKLFSNYKRSNTARNKRTDKSLAATGNETTQNAINNYTNNEQAKADEKFEIEKQKLQQEITDYLAEIDALDIAEDEVMFQSANTAGAEAGEESDAAKEYAEKGTDSKYFRKWFGESKAVDEDNDPKILFRGDVVTFDTFDKEKASAEGDMGAGFYFSDNESDVDSNYYDGGPDFDNKVSRLAEQIRYEKEEEGEDIDFEEAKELAEKQLRGTPQKLEVYLSIQNPVYVGTNETYLLSDIDEYFDINEEDYEDEDEYYQAQEEARYEALGNIGYDIDSELGDLLSYDDIERAKGILFEYVYDGGVTLQTLKDRLNEEYFEDEEGNVVSNEVARRIVKALGYDGIIDDTVSEKFRNMGMEYGTTHYIVFEPEQIKSVENQGTFDSNNANIFYQKTQSFDDELEGDPKVRKVRITNKNNAEVEINNSLWIPTEVMAMEGLNYDKQKIGAETWLDFKRRNLRDYDITKLERLSTSNSNNKTEEKQFNPEIESIAEKYFGTTTNIKEAGYILNNGKLLDLSGKKFGGVAGRRSIDHREVVDAFIESENEDYQDIGFDEFIDNGAIRYMPEADTFLIAKMPSESQFEQLKNIIDSKNGEVSIEMVHGIDSWGKDGNFSKDYEQFSNPSKILDDIRTFFKGGKISPMKTYFQASGYVSKAGRIINNLRSLLQVKAITNVGELFDKIPEMQPVRYYFEKVKDTKVIVTSELEDNYNGKYYPDTNTILINSKIYDRKFKDTARFIHTLAHEMQHAIQEIEYQDALKKLEQNNLSTADRILYEAIKNNRENSNKANKELQDYRKEHQKELAKAFKIWSEGKIYKPRYSDLLQILTTRNELYDNYFYSPNEIDSRKKANEIIAVLGLKGKLNYERKKYDKRTRTNESSSMALSSTTRTNSGLFGSRFDNRTSNSISEPTSQRGSNQVVTYLQSAYHGSAARFDKFSTAFNGTGEGPNAHGWGLYFAGNRDTSDDYKRRLERPILSYKGKKVSEGDGLFFHQMYVNRDNALNTLKGIYESLKNNVEEIKSREDYYTKSDFKNELKKAKERAKHYEKAYKDALKIDVSKIKVENEGQLYEVDIPEDDVLLDEDKDIKDQPQKVQDALYSLLSAEKVPYEYWKGTGKEIYETIKKAQIDTYEPNKNLAKAASLKLNEYGIKGITYDGRQDGRCYVIFDDAAVNIIQTFYQKSGEDDEELNFGDSFEIPEDAEDNQEYYSYLSAEIEYKDSILELETDIATNEEAIAEYNNMISYIKNVSSDITKFTKNNDDIDTSVKGRIQTYISNKRAFGSLLANNEQVIKELQNDIILTQREIGDAKAEIQDLKDSIKTNKENFDRSDYASIKENLDTKKAKDIEEYYGYFMTTNEKNIIGIMNTDNPSTIVHEMGHLFLQGLNEFAEVDADARKRLDEVNKWLGHNEGEPYSVAQQERFARSFEAYLYKGKAPTSKLRQVFEDFKQWLKEVYASIVDIPEVDLSEETQELFDRIFYGEGYAEEKREAQKLYNKINEIRTELPQWAKDEKTTKNKDKETEAYRILSIATGEKESYLRRIYGGRQQLNPSNKMYKIRENIRKEIEEKVAAGDSLSSGDNSVGGYNYAWYSEANDIEETGDGGLELVERVLADIEEKNFNLEITEGDFLDDADAQYQYLLNEFNKTSKNDVADEKQRSIVLAAFYDWIEKNIPEEFQETYTNKFLADTAFTDRRENMDKFARAKEDILNLARETGGFSKNDTESFKNGVIQILNSLKFLNAEDKARLLVNILNTPNRYFLEAGIDGILDIAKTMDDRTLRRNLTKQIHEELMGTKNVKQGARTVGKYDYQTNKLFEKLRELDKLTVDQANDMRLSLEGLSTAEDEGLSFEDKLINEYITFKANGTVWGDTQNIKALYDDIVKVKLAAKDAKSERELLDKLNTSKDVEELVQILNNKKVAKDATKTYINWFGNAESTLNAIFNKHIANKYGSAILQAETDSMVWIYEKKKKFEEGVARIYNLPQWNWDRKILDNLAEKHTFTEHIREYDAAGDVIRDRAIDKEMNKMEIILAWMWDKNEILHKRLVNQFGEEGLNDMFSYLADEDMKLGSLMLHTVNDFYPEVNEMFIKKYGLDMPQVQCYFPSTPERAASEIELLNEYTQQSMNTGFTKQRSKSETLTMNFHNPIQTLYSHIDGVGKFIKMTDILDKSNKVLKDRAIKRLITNKYGADAYKTMAQVLANVSYKAGAKTYSGMNEVFNNIIQNWVQSNVILRPIVGLKQLLSANNYAVDMPYMTWQVGFLKALSQPKKTIEYMMNIPYLKARFGGNYSNEFLQQSIENSKFAATKKLKDYLSLNIKLGDIGAIIFGGKPYIDYLRSQGMSEEEAINKFILSTQRSQQSSAVSSLSNLQVSAKNHPFAQILTAYKNSPQQYVRMCGDAIVSVANGDMTKKQCAKVLFQYLYIQPLFYTMAGSGSLLTLFLSGDDDDLLKDLASSIFNLNSSAIPLLGDAYQFALNRLAYKNKYLPQTTPMLGDIENEIVKISKEDVSLKDYLSFVGKLLQFASGVDVNAVGSMTSSVGDFAQGNIAEGALKAIGYSKKRAKHITGNED